MTNQELIGTVVTVAVPIILRQLGQFLSQFPAFRQAVQDARQPVDAAAPPLKFPE